MRNNLLKIVRWLIEKIEAYEFRHLSIEPLQDLSDKIQNSYFFPETQLLIETDTSWEPLAALHVTRPYDNWKINLSSGKTTQCADHHLFYNETYQKIRASELYAGDQIWTKDGLEEVISCYPTGEKSSMFDATVMSINHRYYGDEILSSNTVMTGIFITWYILFNIDKNVLILANKGATATEIVDKIKTVIKGLPFFLKPGISSNNVMTMRFDNGCRIMSQSTTKSAAIGFTIHLAFMDEFAHIHNNFIEPFYRSVYPTLSSSQISRVIITSTANGRNKFWEIYSNALKPEGEEGKNEYKALRVDWWEVEGRDESWKKREIANLGSEELFNQEYGNQFLAADTLLLSSDSLRFLGKIKKRYVWREIEAFEDEDVAYKDLKWHPNFDIDNISEDDRFFFTVDIGDGIGRDHSVINIFKIQEMSRASMRRLRKDRAEDERAFFRLVQIGIFRSNKTSVEDLARIGDILFYSLFRPEAITVAVEINFKGDLFIEKLKKNEQFFEEMFLHTKHSEKNPYSSLGVKLHKHNKMQFCRELRKLILEKRVIITEEKSFEELGAFGINSKGTYSSQSGHDDIAMTIVYTAPFVVSDDFSFMIEEVVDKSTENFRKEMYSILESEKNSDPSNFSMLKEFM